MIRTLFRALRTGASVPNPTPLKWAGVAVAVAIIALEVAKSHGVLADVSEAALIELVMAALVLYSQIASTDKIGVLPRQKPKVIDVLSDDEIADLLHGVDDIAKRARLRVDREYHGDVPLRDYDFLDDPHAQKHHDETREVIRSNRRDLPGGPYFGGMQPERVQARDDAPESRNSAGFPDGPFFGDSWNGARREVSVGVSCE